MPTINDATVVASAYDTSGNGGRKLVRANNGKLYSITKTSTAIYVHFSLDNGASWLLGSSRTSFTSVQDVTLITNGETVFTLEAINNTTIQCYKIDTSTFSLTSLGTIDSSQTALGNVSLAINDTGTELYATWASKNATYPNSFNIRSAKGTINADGAITWGAAQQLNTYNTSGNYVQNPTAFYIGNIAHVIYEWKNGSNYGISHLSSSDNFATGTSPQLTTVYQQSNPSAIFVPQSINGLANGRIWVAWQGYDSTNTGYFNVRVSYSDDGGVTWSAMQKLTTGNANQVSPSITSNKNNEIFIVWNGVATGQANTTPFQIRKIKNSVGAWGTIIDITNTASSSQYASTLFDISLNFTEPLYIYQAPSKVGFYGTWTVTTISVTQGSIGNKTDKSNLLTYAITTDGTMSTITEKVNGVTIGAKTATSGQSLIAGLTQAQWDAVKFGKYADATGGANTLTVEMGSEKWTYTFDKRLATDADILSAVKAAQDSQTTYLPVVKAKLGSVIRGKGGTVNDTDSWDTMVSAFGGIVVKKQASGTITSSAGTSTFTYVDGTTIAKYSVSVTGITFKPRIIILTYKQNTSQGDIAIYNDQNYDTYPASVKLTSYNSNTQASSTTLNIKGNMSPASVSGTGFVLPVASPSASYTWEAFE